MDNSVLKTLCSHNKKRYYLFLCTGILIFYTIILFFMCDRSLAQKQMFKVPVVVSRIIEIDVRQPVKMVGTVFPLRESIVACEIEGLVVEFPVKRGDYVKDGQVLAKLRTTLIPTLTTLKIFPKSPSCFSGISLVPAYPSLP